MSWLRVWEGSNVTELGCCLNKILYFIFCLCCQIVVKMDICTHKRLHLLKVDDIFTCQCMSFYYKYVNKNVPLFCKSLFTYNATHREYHTRHNLQLVIPYSHTSRARKSVRYHLPSLLRSMPQCSNTYFKWVLFIS